MFYNLVYDSLLCTYYKYVLSKTIDNLPSVYI